MFRASSAPLASPSGRGGRAKRGRRGRVHAQTAAKPSQSPSVTALPKGEPRAGCKSCLHALFSTAHQSQNFRFLSCFSAKPHIKIIKSLVSERFQSIKRTQTHIIQRAQPPRPVFTEPSSNLLHKTNNGEARTSGFRALSANPVHPKPQKPSGRSHRGQVSTEPPPNGPMKLLKTSLYRGTLLSIPRTP